MATKFRKGACENCGALTHKKKDCMERPRKVLAKYTGAEIAPDEFIQPDLKLDFDGKRDRWNGYNPSEHLGIIEEFDKVEDAKRQLKAQRLNTGDEDDGGEEEIDGDEDKYVDEVDMPGTKVDSKQRITVRNLRIREDTAKYLRNLDPNSAYYDPKTRSMRENPYKGIFRYRSMFKKYILTFFCLNLVQTQAKKLSKLTMLVKISFDLVEIPLNMHKPSCLLGRHNMLV